MKLHRMSRGLTVISPVAAALSVFSLCLAGCGGGGSDAISTLIPKAAGGTAAFGASANVDIPAGALAQNTVITIKPVSSGLPAAPGGMAVIPGTAYDFAPDGTAFASSAQMTIAYDP